MKRPPSKPWIGSIRCCRCRPGGLERHGFEYFRHGTLSLYAALNTATARWWAKPPPPHQPEFVAFLSEVVASAAGQGDPHHCRQSLGPQDQASRAIPHGSSRVHLHYTPTYSSWLNQVENWFAKIEREVIARGVFTSVKDLARKLMRYIRHYNKAAVPFRWSYRNTAKRIR